MPEISSFFAFVFIWFIGSFHSSKKSGWSILKDKFALTDRGIWAHDIKLKLGSGELNGVEFVNSLMVGANRHGILLRPVILFRLFHPPLFIPWHAIKEISNERYKRDASSKLFCLIGDKYYSIILIEFPDLDFKIIKRTYELSSILKYQHNLKE